MKIDKAVGKTVRALLAARSVKKVACVLSPQLVVTATMRGTPTHRDTRSDIALTIGRPNHQMRQVIKVAKVAGEPFPIKRLYFRYK